MMTHDLYNIDKYAQKGTVIGTKGSSILSEIERVVGRQSDEIFATWYNEKVKAVDRITFGGLWEDSGAIARHLKSNLGLEKGDLAVLCYNFGLPFIAAFLGCLRAGVVAVLVYPPYPPLAKTLPKMTKVVQDCQPKLILTDSMVNTLRKGDKLNLFSKSRNLWPNTEYVVTDGIPKHHPSNNSALHHEQLLVDDIKGHDVAFVQYTSGSTNDPKGVVVPHKALAANVQLIHWKFRTYFDVIGEDSVRMILGSWMPQYHDMGLVWSIISPLCGGWAIHKMSPIDFIRNPLSWMLLLSRNSCSLTTAPDFAYRLAVRKYHLEKEMWEASAFDLSSMKVFSNGAEPIQADTPAMFEATFKKFGLPEHWLVTCYGMAEHVLAICAFNGYYLSTLRQGDISQYVAVGSRPLMHSSVDVRVVDSITCKTVPDGQTGEIWIRSPCITDGYLGKLDHSSEVFDCSLHSHKQEGSEGGFFRTGDLGFFQEDHLYVCGRIKDVIIINGVNYYPQDIEMAAQEASDAVRPGCVAAFSQFDNGNKADASLEVVFELRLSKESDSDIVLQEVKAGILSRTGLSMSRVVAISEKSIPKTTSGKIKRSAARLALHDGTLEIIGEFSEKDCSASFLPSETPCLQSSNHVELEHGFDSHALVIGAGIVGLCFARDLASLGYKVTVVEKDASVGGVWASNHYPGLRLHSPGYAYRCLSLAPRWTKHHSPDERYRPSAIEVLGYCRELSFHPNITLVLNTECDHRSREEIDGGVSVSVSGKLHKTKYCFVSIGISPKYSGKPMIPASLTCDRVVAGHCVHSSKLSQAALAKCRSQGGKVVLVGSGKAAIDVLELFPPGDEGVLWAHRGHKLFMKRDLVYEAYKDDGVDIVQKIQQCRLDSKNSTERRQHWSHMAFKRGIMISCDGPLSSAEPPYSLGTCSDSQLAHANSFKQLRINKLELSQNGCVTLIPFEKGKMAIALGTSDLVVLCTGQVNENWDFPRFTMSSGVSAPFASLVPLSSLVPLRMALFHLRGEDAAARHALQIVNTALEGVRSRRIEDAYLLHMEMHTALSECTESILSKKSGLDEFSSYREWISTWHGRDLPVDFYFQYMQEGRAGVHQSVRVSTPSESKSSKKEDHGAIVFGSRLSLLLHCALMQLDRSGDGQPDGDGSTLSIGDYKTFYGQLCAPPLARRALASITGILLSLPHDYPRDASLLRKYAHKDKADKLLHYFSFSRDSGAGLASLFGFGECLTAEDSRGAVDKCPVPCDAHLVVESCVLEFLRQEANARSLQIVCTFEFQLNGVTGTTTIFVLHVLSNDGLLHAIQVCRRVPYVGNESAVDKIDSIICQCRDQFNTTQSKNHGASSTTDARTNGHVGRHFALRETAGFFSLLAHALNLPNSFDVLLDPTLISSKSHLAGSKVDEMQASEWFVARGLPPKLESGCDTLLFCFHGMAGSASMSFGDFDSWLPTNVFPYVIQLPGNDLRASEPYPTDGKRLLMPICRAIKKVAGNKNVALLGYSIGGQMALLAANILFKEMHLKPIHTTLIASPPHTDSLFMRSQSVSVHQDSYGPFLEYYLARAAPLLHSLRKLCENLWGPSPPILIPGSQLLVLAGKNDLLVPHGVVSRYWSYPRLQLDLEVLFVSGAGHYMPEDPNAGFGKNFNDKHIFDTCWDLVATDLTKAASQTPEDKFHDSPSVDSVKDDRIHVATSETPHEDWTTLARYLSSLLDKLLTHLDTVTTEESLPVASVSFVDYKLFHGMLCSPKIAKQALSSITGSFLFLPFEHSRDLDELKRYDIVDLSISRYYRLVKETMTGLSSLFGQTRCLYAREIDRVGQHIIGKDDDAPLVVDECVVEYIKRKEHVSELRLIRQFEYEFGGFAGVSVAMHHFLSDDGALHVVEVVRNHERGGVRDMAQIADECRSKCREAADEPSTRRCTSSELEPLEQHKKETPRLSLLELTVQQGVLQGRIRSLEWV